MDIKQQINEVIAEVSAQNVDPEQIDSEHELDGIGIGYFGMVDFVVRLEQEVCDMVGELIQPDIEDQIWADWQTVGDVYRHFGVSDGD